MLGNLLILCVTSLGQKWKAIALYDSFSTSHLNEGKEGYFLHLIKSNLFTLTANFAFNSLKKQKEAFLLKLDTCRHPEVPNNMLDN